MKEIDKVHWWQSEVRVLISEVDYLENIIVDAMMLEEDSQTHQKLNGYWRSLESHRSDLNSLYHEIEFFSNNLSQEHDQYLTTFAALDSKVENQLNITHRWKDEICEFIATHIDQRNIA